MATWHLEEIEKRLDQIGWHIISQLEGDDYAISASWIICRKTERQLDIIGFDDMYVKPIDQAYACKIIGTRIDLYFYRKGRMWDQTLDEFVSRLNELD